MYGSHAVAISICNHYKTHYIIVSSPRPLVVGHTGPLLVLLLVEISNPLLGILHLGLVNLHNLGVDLSVGENQVVAVCSLGHDAHGGFHGRLERTAGPVRGGDGSVNPGVELAVCPHQAGGVDGVPAAGVLVDHIGGTALHDADNVVAHGREVEGAFAIVVFFGDKGRDDAGFARRGSCAPPLESEDESIMLEPW